MKKIIFIILKFLSKKVIKKYRPLVIGITGSVGKTSAKEAIFTVLKSKFKVRANKKNYNNEIGVPLTILGCESGGRSIFKWFKVFSQGLFLIFKKDSHYPEMLVLEMGADKIGDIEYLVKFVPCDIGVVTAVGEVHFEFFGSLENIVKEKQKIISHLKESHLAVLNADDKNVIGMRTLTKARVVSFGTDPEADFRATNIKLSQKDGEIGTSFKLEIRGNVLPIFLNNALGQAQVNAVLSAIAVADSLKVSLLEIIESLSRYKAPAGRTKLIKGIKNTKLIDDSYNSSPLSAKAALDLVAKVEIAQGAKRIAIFGEMLELGSYTSAGHKEVGQKAAEINLDLLVGVGEKCRDILRGAKDSGLAEEKTFFFANNHEAGIFVQDRIQAGDLILIKGSQGARMEQITKELMAEPLRVKELLVRQTEEWF